MTDEEIVLYFNEHRLAKLEKYLLKNGSSVEHELQNLLDRFYEQTVPERERMEIEAKIELESEQEAAMRFAVVHLHDSDDDFLFTTELRNDFYSMAYLYQHELKDMVGAYTLDSLADRFGSYQAINAPTFSVLCDAMPNDSRITALVEFDFEHNTVSVRGSGGNEWRAYDLKDVSAAICRAERKNDLSLVTRREIFNESLVGKEIAPEIGTETETETDEPTLRM